MKGCFLLQRQFAYVGHAIARNLSERYGIKEFCAYVYQRSSYDFLKQQTDISYSSLLLDEDVHARYRDEPIDHAYLSWLEREYGLPNAWPYLAIDRVLMHGQLVREYPHDQPLASHEELLRMLQVRAKAILELLDREKPDFVFASVLGGVGNFFLYQAAKKRGIPTFIVHPSLLPNRYLLSDVYERFSGVDTLFLHDRDGLRHRPAWEEAGRVLERFRASPTPYLREATPGASPVSRRRQLKFLNPVNALRWLREFSGSVAIHYTTPYRHDFSYIGPWNYLRDMLKRKARNLIGLEDLYDPFTPEDDAFAFFPLQFEPEISISLHAPHRTDQVELVRQAAQALPVSWKLYVKEHPVMAEYRPRSFYKALKKIPNVRLLAPTISSFAITPRAKLVFTITGTVGWEAVMLRKPVISFGHWFYNTLPMIRYCENLESLADLVRSQRESFQYDEDAMRGFLAALLEESIEVDLTRLWTHEADQERRKEGLRPLADLLAKKLGLPYSPSV